MSYTNMFFEMESSRIHYHAFTSFQEYRTLTDNQTHELFDPFDESDILDKVLAMEPMMIFEETETKDYTDDGRYRGVSSEYRILNAQGVGTKEFSVRVENFDYFNPKAEGYLWKASCINADFVLFSGNPIRATITDPKGEARRLNFGWGTDALASIMHYMASACRFHSMNEHNSALFKELISSKKLSLKAVS